MKYVVLINNIILVKDRFSQYYCNYNLAYCSELNKYSLWMNSFVDILLTDKIKTQMSIFMPKKNDGKFFVDANSYNSSDKMEKNMNVPFINHPEFLRILEFFLYLFRKFKDFSSLQAFSRLNSNPINVCFSAS